MTSDWAEGSGGHRSGAGGVIGVQSRAGGIRVAWGVRVERPCVPVQTVSHCSSELDT